MERAGLFQKKTIRDIPVWIALYVGIIALWGIVIGTTTVSWISGTEVIVDNGDISFITGPLLAFNLIFFGSTLVIFIVYFVFYQRVVSEQMMSRMDTVQSESKIDTEAKSSQVIDPSSDLCSIIIPARNEENVIVDTVLNCLSQTRKRIEVVVVCHNCSDKTYLRASKIQDSRVRAFELKTKEAGKGIALNYGVQMARGQFLLILDGDGKLNPSFIDDAIPLLSDDRTAAVQGRYIPSNRNYNFVTRMLSMEGDLWSTPFMTIRHLVGKRTPLGGTGYIIKRDALASVGGFKNHLVDDYELTFRLLRNNYQIAFAPLSVNYDEKPATVDIMIRQRARWVRGFLDLLKIRVAQPKDILGNLYWVNPLSAFSGLALLGITAFSTIHYLAFHYFPFHFSYISLSMWSLLTLTTYSMYTAVLYKQYGKVGLKYAAWLPLYLPFSNYYMVASLKAMFVKSWADTKTMHGFVKAEAVSTVRKIRMPRFT